MGKLDGRTILVTGAARGQGEAEARQFAEEGACVALGDIRDPEGEAVAKSLGSRAFYLHHDVSDQKSWKAFVAAAQKRFGRIDGLVNNAGIAPVVSLLEMPLEQYRKVIDVNQVGTFLGLQTASKVMIEAGNGGSIVNISSTAGFRGAAMFGGYSSTKFAVRGLTRTAAIELGRHRIRVNSIHPGGIDTPMGRGEDIDPDNTAAVAAFYAALPLGRIGQPIEIARLALYLLSDDSSFCTGAEFVADGGELAGDCSLLADS